MSDLVVRQQQKIHPKGKWIFGFRERKIVRLNLMVEPINRTAERNNSGNALNPEADDFPELKIPYERKFKCTYCGRKYRSKNGLRRHMEDHGESGVHFLFFILFA